MQGNQQQHQTAQQTASPDERLLAHLEEINFLREQVEFLREMVESQNLHLHDNEQKLQEVELELRATNQDLCTVLSLAGSSH